METQEKVLASAGVHFEMRCALCGGELRRYEVDGHAYGLACDNCDEDRVLVYAYED